LRKLQGKSCNKNQREYRIEIAYCFAAPNPDQAEALVERCVTIGMACCRQHNPQHGFVMFSESAESVANLRDVDAPGAH
jgi:uncharacterized UBP type Zn finger protein